MKINWCDNLVDTSFRFRFEWNIELSWIESNRTERNENETKRNGTEHMTSLNMILQLVCVQVVWRWLPCACDRTRCQRMRADVKNNDTRVALCPTIDPCIYMYMQPDQKENTLCAKTYGKHKNKWMCRHRRSVETAPLRSVDKKNNFYFFSKKNGAQCIHTSDKQLFHMGTLSTECIRESITCCLFISAIYFGSWRQIIAYSCIRIWHKANALFVFSHWTPHNGKFHQIYSDYGQ